MSACFEINLLNTLTALRMLQVIDRYLKLKVDLVFELSQCCSLFPVSLFAPVSTDTHAHVLLSKLLKDNLNNAFERPEILQVTLDYFCDSL